MSYLALYRKHRPQRFSEMVGQEHVVTTLQNALASGRVSHAYLFCGSRGTGKTTMAKLLAKALNCLDLKAGEPCNACAHCQRIDDQSFMDILEIDAASNRGIDEIRELREKIKLSPAEGSYKVYIIDEVHMLTTEAFNALLKTLEEPPAHAVFILATTEPHRLPLTILSRCQRYDFHRIKVEDIQSRLKEVLALQNKEADPEALALIAKMAAGGMRDALGMLDQCLTSTEGPLEARQVAKIIGVADDDFLYDWVEHLRAADVSRALLSLQGALEEGKQSGQLLKGLIQYFRNLLVLQMEGGERLVPVAKDLAQKMKDQGQMMGTSRILSLMERLGQAQSRIRYEGDGQLLLEMEIIHLCRAFGQPALEEERPAASKAAASQSLSPSPSRKASQGTEGFQGGQEPKGPKGSVEKAGQGHKVTKPASGQVDKDVSKKANEELNKEANIKVNQEASKDVSKEAKDTKEERHRETVGQQGSQADMDLEAIWAQVKAGLQDKKEIKILAFVKEASLSFDQDRWLLSFGPKYGFHKTNTEKAESRKILEDLLAQAGQGPYPLVCQLEGEKVKKEEPDDLVKTVEDIFGKENIMIMEEE